MQTDLCTKRYVSTYVHTVRTYVRVFVLVLSSGISQLGCQWKESWKSHSATFYWNHDITKKLRGPS